MIEISLKKNIHRFGLASNQISFALSGKYAAGSETADGYSKHYSISYKLQNQYTYFVPPAAAVAVRYFWQSMTAENYQNIINSSEALFFIALYGADIPPDDLTPYGTGYKVTAHADGLYGVFFLYPKPK